MESTVQFMVGRRKADPGIANPMVGVVDIRRLFWHRKIDATNNSQHLPVQSDQLQTCSKRPHWAVLLYKSSNMGSNWPVGPGSEEALLGSFERTHCWTPSYVCLIQKIWWKKHILYYWLAVKCFQVHIKAAKQNTKNCVDESHPSLISLICG